MTDELVVLRAKVTDAKRVLNEVGELLALNTAWEVSRHAQTLLTAAARMGSPDPYPPGVDGVTVVGGVVNDSGSGHIDVLVDRSTDDYPLAGSRVVLLAFPDEQ